MIHSNATGLLFCMKTTGLMLELKKTFEYAVAFNFLCKDAPASSSVLSLNLNIG